MEDGRPRVFAGHPAQMYHGRVQALFKTVLAYVRKHKLFSPGGRVGVAVSAGLDSVALLRLLLELRHELGIVVSVVHFNHKLRQNESNADECFVASLAKQHSLEIHVGHGDVRTHAAAKHLSLETAARQLRYEYFRQLLLDGTLSSIATAHTLDDQAETVLLRLGRGAGTRGLAGIYPGVLVSGEKSKSLAIVRPLLCIRRNELEPYLNSVQQTWREDSSNRDLRHARNRVRHEVLPVLERDLNPAVREVFAETAEIARAEEEYWAQQTSQLLPAIWEVAPDRNGGVFKAGSLSSLPLAVQRRLIRAAAESLGLRLEFRHVEEILASGNSVSLPHGWQVQAQKAELIFRQETERPTQLDYEFRLPLPGTVDVPPLGSRFEAILVSRAAVYNPEHLLDRTRLRDELQVRNWRAGDRFHPTHSKGPRKVKELLQKQHVTGSERKLWPVLVSGSDLVWVRGFAVSANFQLGNGSNDAVLVREVPLSSGERVFSHP